MRYSDGRFGLASDRGSFRARFATALGALLVAQGAVALTVAWYQHPAQPLHHLPAIAAMLAVSFPVLAAVCGLWAWLGRTGVSSEEAEDLLVSKGLYRALVERSSNVFAMCLPDGKIVYCSPAVHTVVGRSPDELNGRNVFDLVHPDDARGVASMFEFLVAHPAESTLVEFRLKGPDGGWLQFESAANAIVDSDTGATGIVGSLRDISKHKRREEDLVRTSEELERLVDERTQELARSGALLASLADAQSRFITNRQLDAALSPLLKDLLALTGSPDGYLAEVVRDNGPAPHLQTRALTVLSPGWRRDPSHTTSSETTMDLDVLGDDFRRAIEACEPFMETEGHPAAGSLGPLPDDLPIMSFMALPLRDTRPVIGVIGLANRPDGYTSDFVDGLRPFAATCGMLIEANRSNLLREEVEQMLLEARATLERTVEERTLELRTSMEQLAEANRQKSRFLSSLSHELRTPLNSVLGFADLLKGQHYGPLNDKQTEYVGHIEEGGRRLHALIGDLLDIVKIDTGRMELELVNLAVGDCLKSIALSFEAQARVRGLEMTVEADDDAPGVRADPDRCRQILVNLMSNAMKFTPEGGRVRLHAEASGPDSVRFSVSDTGTGIEPEALPKVFSEFYQEDRVYDEQLGGTGIGLALTRRLVELQGGQIGVESRPQQGATFWFTLPTGAP
ncbi:MAG: PAS domain S-box protein [bacterium]|nr:PAS domain S-box protein [bacterium]